MQWKIPVGEKIEGPFWNECRGTKPHINNMVWQDISTAPKDGTMILLSIVDKGNRFTCPGSWDIIDSNFGDDVMGWCGLNGNPLTTEYTEWQTREVSNV